MRLTQQEAQAWQALHDQYELATGDGEPTLQTILAWADLNDVATPAIDINPIRLAYFSAALRMDQSRDGQGRLTRNRHCREITVHDNAGRPAQLTLWAHVNRATPAFLTQSLHQRRQRIVGHVEKLRADVDRCNGILTGQGAPPVQMTFNFDHPDEVEGET